MHASNIEILGPKEKWKFFNHESIEGISSLVEGQVNV